MRYRPFAATRDELGVLGFDAMGMAGWFGSIDDRDAIRALQTALDLGVNMIDTARAGTFPGDHAGRFEISQLMYCRPELVDLTRVERTSDSPLGRFAQNPDAHEATADYGELVIETMINEVGRLVDDAGLGAPDLPFLSFDDLEPAWAAVESHRPSWVSYGPEGG